LKAYTTNWTGKFISWKPLAIKNEIEALIKEKSALSGYAPPVLD